MVSYANTGLATLFLGNGNGTFNGPYDMPGLGALFVTVTDVNRDGIPDLVMPIVSTENVEVFLGKGDGTFEAPMVLTAPVQPSSAAIGDFNGDGEPDLAVTSQASNSIAVFLNGCVKPNRKHAIRK